MKTEHSYKTKEDVLDVANLAIDKRLKDFMEEEDISSVLEQLEKYRTNRKGFFGDLVEKYIFGLDVNNKSEADFKIAGIELKTSPLKKNKSDDYRSKERLVFSMIDYDRIVHEKWETSSFLEKNKLVLIMFYLFEMQKSILDYRFKFVHLLDFLSGLSEQDMEQIRKDWEFIVNKIRKGEAHLLSEGDTFYLGACTKAKNSTVVRDQPLSRMPAKPRAFSLKQTYLNYLVRKNLLKEDVDSDSLFRIERKVATIEDMVTDKFKKYIGKTDSEIMDELNWHPNKRPKNFKRLLANRIMIGTGSNRIEELDKANVTLKVITLEHTGTLRESLSFPAFDYNDLITQSWYDEEDETMADFHAQLEMKKFLFVVFQKEEGSEKIILKKIKFWNFPMKDISEAERVFERTVECIKEGRYEDLPKISESEIAHVRPHGKDSSDTLKTPQGTSEVKRCFWLNAKYIRKMLET